MSANPATRGRCPAWWCRRSAPSTASRSGRSSLAARKAAAASRAPHENRNRALIGVRLAEVQLRRRHPAHAADTITRLASDLALVTSGRITQALVHLRAAWRPYLNDPTVRTADELLSPLISGHTSR
ncbi:hypothetical protein LO762_09440 [Actinocorallia sp. API 0066]|uniref:hypothetical protein n=1 Tax=Actinocorallia sp. API 0066 TaxID=2896846 RepID=UPI001E4FAB49|nr:hypothetical protein [Actinocorallia sp. API 0066]MCD0449410.1 hypothetical protein [Actinocorallia sp. API 0066]